MSYFDSLIERSVVFAENGFTEGLKMLPSKKTVVIGRVDPRVEPADIFDLMPGDAAAIRNVGARTNPVWPRRWPSCRRLPNQKARGPGLVHGISGLVYDVSTGRTETVVAPARLRDGR